MSERFILALDEGTSSLRTVVFDLKGAIRGVSQLEFEQIFPKPGLAEHDAEEIWNKQHETMIGALQAAGRSPVQSHRWRHRAPVPPLPLLLLLPSS